MHSSIKFTFKKDSIIKYLSYDFDYVIHLAAISNPAEKDKNIIYEVNVDGTKNLLDSLINKKILKKIILSSSANVYSRNIEGQINLNSLLKPFNDYGKAIEMEKTSLITKKTLISLSQDRLTTLAMDKMRVLLFQN